jgi:hypothetical protein
MNDDIMNDVTVTGETITTLRRRVVDKLCKDNLFLVDVIGYAIRKGKIQYQDILTFNQIELFQWKK